MSHLQFRTRFFRRHPSVFLSLLYEVYIRSRSQIFTVSDTVISVRENLQHHTVRLYTCFLLKLLLYRYIVVRSVIENSDVPTKKQILSLPRAFDSPGAITSKCAMYLEYAAIFFRVLLHRPTISVASACGIPNTSKLSPTSISMTFWPILTLHARAVLRIYSHRKSTKLNYRRALVRYYRY